MNPRYELTQEVARVLGVSPSRVFLYWKGRVALYALLRAMGVGSGDEVILPGLTCVVVPNAIMYVGGRPIYADVCADTLTMDVDAVKQLVTTKTKVIISQNIYGLSVNIDRLMCIAEDRGIAVIGDCAHGFGGSYRGKPNGTIGDGAFFSTQWNKPFSTGLGGILVVNRSDIADRVRRVNQELLPPRWSELLSLRLSLFARKHVVSDGNYWRCVNIFRYLSRLGLVTGSSSNAEMETVSIPEGYFKSMSDLQASIGIEAIRCLPALQDRRRVVAVACREVLARHARWHIPGEYDQEHGHLKLPILVQNRREFMARAERAHVRVLDWFVSPIHPITAGLERWHLDPCAIPVSTRMAARLVSIETDVKDPERVCGFLEDNIGLIE